METSGSSGTITGSHSALNPSYIHESPAATACEAA